MERLKLYVVLQSLYLMTVSSLEQGVFTECTGNPYELVCYGPTNEYCYMLRQRCDGVPDCPYSHLADECICEQFCSTMPDYRYCQNTDTCIPWGEPCPEDIAKTQKPEPECPSFAPHRCFKQTNHLPLSTYVKLCYSSEERCNGVNDCLNGEDEDSCPVLPAAKAFVVIVIIPCVLGFIVTLCLFFAFRHWRKRRNCRRTMTPTRNDNTGIVDVDFRLRFNLDLNRSHGDVSNPVYGLPPPSYQEENPNALPQVSDEINELPPPYLLTAPSNEGPKSVLPTYHEAINSKESLPSSSVAASHASVSFRESENSPHSSQNPVSPPPDDT